MTAKPFMFDLAFDTPDDPPAANTAPPEPQFGVEELETARAEAYAEGAAAGQAEANAQFDHASQQLLQTISMQLKTACASADAALAETAALAPSMTVAALKKAFPALAEIRGHDEILSVIRQAISNASDEPRMVIRLNDSDYEPMDTAAKPLATEAGYPGRLVTLSDANVAPGDVQVEWADGGVIRNVGRLTDSIAEALASLATPISEDFNPEQDPETAPTEATREGAADQ